MNTDSSEDSISLINNDIHIIIYIITLRDKTSNVTFPRDEIYVELYCPVS